MRLWLLLHVAVGAKLYAVRAPLRTGNLAVGGQHSLYFELHGRASGAAALFLHGGPGAGSSSRHAGFFDPLHYQVVLFDQRGCGRSTPKGCLEENDTPRLIADCEALRLHLGFERWEVVLGGSWGVALALAYAKAHPARIGALVLRAVCLMRPSEISWVFGARGGSRRLLPKGWEAFEALCPTAPHADGDPDGVDDTEVLRWYANAFATNGEASSAAVGAWFKWEMQIFGLGSRLPALEDGGRVWTWRPRARRWTTDQGRELTEEEVKHALCDSFEPRIAAGIEGAAAGGLAGRAADAVRKTSGIVTAAAGAAVNGAAGALSAAAQPTKATIEPAIPTSRSSPADSADGSTMEERVDGPNTAAPAPPSASVPAQALLTAHYSVNSAFMVPEDYLLGAVSAFRNIPCIAVQGGNDLVCPPQTAYELHQAWPEMELRVVHGSGHSMYDAGLLAEVVRATDYFRDLSRSDEPAGRTTD